MPLPSADVTAALATLRARWGAAAPQIAGIAGIARTPGIDGAEVRTIGALAALPLYDPDPVPATEPFVPEPLPFDDRPPDRAPRPDDGRIVPTGFAALDAILGPGGVPRLASVALEGGLSSGKTTLALRLAAEAQAGGAIVAYVDLAGSFDPVEAVARGVRLEWLVVLTPASIDEALAMAGALLQGRAVDLLLMDLPAGLRAEPRHPVSAGVPAGQSGQARPPSGRSVGSGRPPSLADRLHRLAALARRAGCLLVVLEPPGLPSAVSGALGEAIGLRLELVRRAWIRLGRDIVGQQTEVVVARNRFGPPGRRAELRILYADGGGRDACLAQGALLGETPPRLSVPIPLPVPRVADRPAPKQPAPTQPLRILATDSGPPAQPTPAAPDLTVTADAPDHSPRTRQHATAPPALAAPAAPARPEAVGDRQLHFVSNRPSRPGRPALDRRTGRRHEPGRPGDGRSTRDPARVRAPVGAGGALPRP